MSLSEHVRILGRGPGRSRSLSLEEARDAMRLILTDQAAPEAVGALLMLLRMKGETPDEIAGFAMGARQDLTGRLPVDLDWPSYAAGRTRGLPWFLLSARVVAMAGYKVLLHGWNSHQASHASVRDALPLTGVPIARDLTGAEAALAAQNICYLPLESFAPRLHDLLLLRDTLGLRSCINTVVRVLNPFDAPAGVQGVFHPPYRALQQEASLALGQPALSVIKGGGGEFERNPGKQIEVFGLRSGALWEAPAAPVLDAARRMGDGPTDPGCLAALWSGDWHDAYCEEIVLGTAALALDTLGASDPDRLARQIWTSRLSARAA
ncbi:glycosyl transferase family protein [Pseudoprimorskyibacter insulae]|uniref:Anthranilate phosphoribosyltransferase n=1 Tax=Pseudoprimorskyibacter insulae TaxID=1695997 RepID=A0A2R8AV16_9RHOB|nr:glycosyl transferase family protein [Pseudoprimorskyibacter insulae]SPF79856.1 Anthranilate phosphoribosyltransferase [Pseudoprimorskyibacter insulae]